jgi:hypothetical protein
MGKKTKCIPALADSDVFNIARIDLAFDPLLQPNSSDGISIRPDVVVSLSRERRLPPPKCVVPFASRPSNLSSRCHRDHPSMLRNLTPPLQVGVKGPNPVAKEHWRCNAAARPLSGKGACGRRDAYFPLVERATHQDDENS